MRLESFFTVNEQLRLFLICCLLGFPAGILYDIFRVLRIFVPHHWIIIAIEDFIFFIIYSVFITTFTLTAARGEFRLYYIIGNFIGFTIYYFTFGRIIKKIFLKLSHILKKYINEIIISPIKKVIIYKKNNKSP